MEVRALTLDEEIKRCEEIAETQEWMASSYDDDSMGRKLCNECASEHRQLAEWLKALKEIWDSGSCNDCKFSGHCEIQPKLGQLARFNCYHFSKREVNADDE